MFPPRFLVLAVVLVFAAPAAAAPVPPPAPDPAAAAVARAKKALDTRVDFALDGASFDELATFVKAKCGLDLVVSDEVGSQQWFSRSDPGKFEYSLVARDTRVRDGLAALLSPHKIGAGIVDGRLIVAPAERLTELRMRQTVTVAADAEPLPKLLADLTARTAVEIVLDPRCARAAATAAVTISLDDTQLETAARLAAEFAGFAVVRFEDVLLVTAPDRATVLRPLADPPAELLDVRSEERPGMFGGKGRIVYRVHRHTKLPVINRAD